MKNFTIKNIELLAHRAYPELKSSGFCSNHQNDGYFECEICYPNWHTLLNEHFKVFNQLYDELLKLSGLSELPNGHIGTNAIIAEIRRKLEINKKK